MRLNSRRTRGCATSQTTLLAVALLTFMGAGVLWSVSGKSAEKAPKQRNAAQNRVMMAQTQPQTAIPVPLPATVKARHLMAAAKLPLAFEPNQGQTDARASYIAHGAGYGLFLTPKEAILSLGGISKNAVPVSANVHMQLEGASASPKIAATEPLPGKSSYFRGNDPSRWVRNVPTFARVRYSEIYPGIDLVFYGKQGQLEYDFALRPGANPRQIRLNLSGVESVSLAPDGSLSLKTPAREVRWNKPVIYQEVNGHRHPVVGGFQLLAQNQIGFALGSYDRSRDLIIDPVLAYATYFGGSGDEMNPQVAVDVNSNIYMAGTTSSSAGFPAEACGGTSQPLCPVLSGVTDVFVSKLDSFGASVVYTVYLNGTQLGGLGSATGTDASAGLAVDNQGNAYITGTTGSTNFPITANAFQAAPKAPGQHVFISKLGPTGATLLYSSYLSGTNTDNALALAADNTGDAYILGWTQSVTDGDFPTGTSFQQHANGATRLFFVSKFDTTQTVGNQTLKFFSYLGGGDATISAAPADGVVCAQLPCGGIAIDSTGNAYVGLGTTFTNLAVTNAFQSTNHGKADAFLAKITADGSALLYSTYLGGAQDDVANAIALDSSGNAYITGSTTSTDFPAGTTKVFSTLAGPQDAFVAKFNNPTSGPIALTFTSYLGGSGNDTGLGIVADVPQNAFVVGSTNSPNFPAPGGATLATNGGSTDAFLAKFSTSTTAILSFSSSSLLGGTQTERATSVAQNTNAGIVVVGETNSADFPVQNHIFTVPHPLQTALSGPSDAFLVDYGPNADLSLTAAASPSPVAVGNAATFTFTVKNNGPDSSTGAVVTIPAPSAGGSPGAFSSTSGSCAATGATGSQIETCTLGTIAANLTATITVPVTPTVIAKTGAIPASISMTGSVVPGNSAFDGNLGNNSASATDTVEYFTSTVAPSSVRVIAGQTATYTITLTPNSKNGFPANITPKCVPPTTPVALAGTTCTFTPTPVATIPSTSGTATSILKITTTASTQTASVGRGPTFWYALWLPVCGVALFGAGSSRRRRWVSGAALVVLLGTLAWLPACGSKASTTPTTGTQPGTYAISITATSGTYVYPPSTSPLNVSLVVTAN